MAKLTEYCTIAYAAERLGLSVRQVGRYVLDGTLTGITPLTGSRESQRHKRMVRVADVERLKLARSVTGRG